VAAATAAAEEEEDEEAEAAAVEMMTLRRLRKSLLLSRCWLSLPAPSVHAAPRALVRSEAVPEGVSQLFVATIGCLGPGG
jgi:hypothetical protein